MSNVSLLLNLRVMKTISGVSATNKRLSALDIPNANSQGNGRALFLAILRGQRQQLSLAQELLADRIARSAGQAPSPLAVDYGQLQGLGAELERMSQLVDRLLAVAEKSSDQGSSSILDRQICISNASPKATVELFEHALRQMCSTRDGARLASLSERRVVGL